MKERVQSEQIFIEHIGINSMIVDLLTKGLTPKVFHEHAALWVLYHLRKSCFSGSLYIYFTALFYILDTFYIFEHFLQK